MINHLMRRPLDLGWQGAIGISLYLGFMPPNPLRSEKSPGWRFEILARTQQNLTRDNQALVKVLRNLLQPRCDVHRIAQDREFLTGLVAHAAARGGAAPPHARPRG